jgi:hypothetical protein
VNGLAHIGVPGLLAVQNDAEGSHRFGPLCFAQAGRSLSRNPTASGPSTISRPSAVTRALNLALGTIDKQACACGARPYR